MRTNDQKNYIFFISHISITFSELRSEKKYILEKNALQKQRPRQEKFWSKKVDRRRKMNPFLSPS